MSADKKNAKGEHIAGEGSEASSIPASQKRVGSDSTSSRDSLPEDDSQTLSSAAMTDSSSLFVLGLRANKKAVSVPGLLLQDNQSPVTGDPLPADKRAKSSDASTQVDWLGADTTLDAQAIHRIVQPEQETDGLGKTADQKFEMNRVMHVYRTGIDHVHAGNLQSGIDMLTATKAILEGNNAPASVIAELNHYLALAYARLEQKSAQDIGSAKPSPTADAAPVVVAGKLQVQNIFDSLTAEQVVQSHGGIQETVQTSQLADSSLFSGIDKHVTSDLGKQTQSAGDVETSDIELVADQAESPQVVNTTAEKKQPTNNRKVENQNQDPAIMQEQAQLAQEAREKRKQFALKIIRKLPFKNLKFSRVSDDSRPVKKKKTAQDGKGEGPTK